MIAAPMKRHLARLTLGGFLLMQVAAHAVYAEESNALKATIQKLQEENKGLQEQLNKHREILEQLLQKTDKLETPVQSPVEKAPSPVPSAPPPKAVSHEEAPPATSAGHDEHLALQSFIPTLSLRGFGDVNFVATDERNGTKHGADTFSLGQLDLFITSILSDALTFTSEIVFEFDSQTNEAVVDVERLQLKYAFSDLLHIRFGRMHTPLGYWNQTFHHGTWFQTTAFRPDIYRFEDDGGILPVHAVGIEFFGTKVFAKLDFGYSLTVANGRGRTVSEVQNFTDANKSKAINVLFTIAPRAVSGLIVGLNTYYDIIPPDPTNPPRNGDIDEFIVGGHAVYLTDNVELLGEIFRIQHHDRVSKQRFNTLGAYVQAAYRLGLWKPYYRFDYIDYGHGDPFYAPNDIDISKHTIGLRWDPLTWMGLKLEYGYNQRRHARDSNALALQSAFTF